MKLKLRKYDPKVEPTNYWRDLLRDWKREQYLEAFEGLMHHAAARMSPNKFNDSIQEKEILNFFLFYSKDDNPFISRKAQQLLVGQLLPNWRSFANPGSEVIHEKFQQIFSEPTFNLHFKSYYDSVSKYIQKFRHLLVGEGAPITGLNLPEQNCQNEVQNLFESFVLMAIEWSYVKHAHHSNIQPLYRIDELERILEGYLAKDRPNDFFAIQRISYMFATAHNAVLSASPETLDRTNCGPRKDLQVFLLLMDLRHNIRRLPIWT